MCVLVAQSCPTLCNSMDCSPPGSCIHRILQARILEWVAISFSRSTFLPRDWTRVSWTAGRFFTIWATREDIAVFGTGMKTDLFQSCGHCWIFQIWHIECNTFTEPSFRIWNSSAGVPSPPLALFVVMFPKAHLTSHSRVPGSSWVIAPLWLFGSLRSFLYTLLCILATSS